MDSRTVLVVDDDEMVRNLLSAVLNKGGYFPILEASGRDALRALRNTRVDLIVLDINMPGMNGVEFLRRIQGKGIPVVMFTAFAQKELVLACRQLGAVDYIAKSTFRTEIFLNRIKHYLHQRLAKSNYNDPLEPETKEEFSAYAPMEVFSEFTLELIVLAQKKPKSQRALIKKLERQKTFTYLMKHYFKIVRGQSRELDQLYSELGFSTFINYACAISILIDLARFTPEISRRLLLNQLHLITLVEKLGTKLSPKSRSKVCLCISLQFVPLILISVKQPFTWEAIERTVRDHLVSTEQAYLVQFDEPLNFQTLILLEKLGLPVALEGLVKSRVCSLAQISAVNDEDREGALLFNLVNRLYPLLGDSYQGSLEIALIEKALLDHFDLQRCNGQLDFFARRDPFCMDLFKCLIKGLGLRGEFMSVFRLSSRPDAVLVGAQSGGFSVLGNLAARLGVPYHSLNTGLVALLENPL